MIKRCLESFLFFFFFFQTSLYSETWEDQGLSGGQIPTLAVDPGDGNCLYAGSWKGDGLFKTTNGGEQWYSVEGFRNKDLRSIVIDPKDPLTIWAVSISSLHKSIDGGKTWITFEPARKGKEWRNYFSLAIDPHNSKIVYVGCSGYSGSDRGGCLLKTEDAGRTWRQLDIKADHIPWAIALNPQSSKEVWFVTDTFSGEDGSIYQSKDGGLSWMKVETHLNPGWFEEIVINPLNPKTIYVGGENGVYRTKDGGKTWKQLQPDTWCEALILAPDNSEIIYAAWNLNLSKSSDGGDTWITYDLSSGLFPLEFLTLAINPQNHEIIYGGDSNLGVFKSVDGGATWTPVNQGIRANAVFCSEIQVEGMVYTGTIAGLYRRDKEDKWICLNSRNTFAFKSDPSDPEILYAGFNWDLEKSLDGGVHWEKILSPSRFDPNRIETIAVHPVDTRIIYAGVFFYSAKKGEIYRSEDSGKTWVKIFRTYRPVNVIVIDPLNPLVIYAGTGYRDNPSLTGNLYRSDDGGNTWQLTSLREKVVNDIAVDPLNPEILYVGTTVSEGSTSSGLYKSIDGGRSWVEKTEGIPPGATVTSLKIVPSSSIIYAATLNKGVYASLDSGEYWILLGLSDYITYDLLMPFLFGLKLSPPEEDLSILRPIYAGTASGFLRFNTSGVGMIEGMIINCADQKGITGAEVSTDQGGKALSLEGYFLLMVPTGICTVIASADCYHSSEVRQVAVNEFEVATVDLCILPVEGIMGKVTTQGKVVQGAMVTISEEGMKIEETYTDGEGRYGFFNLESGSYFITVTKKGYRIGISDEIIYAGNTCIIQNFELVKK